MARFMILVCGDAGDASATELGGRTARQAEWIGKLRSAGVLADGGRIGGDSLRIRSAIDRPAVIDIPPDAIGAARSWLMLEVIDLASAVAIAESCPEAVYGDVRVVPVDG